MGFITAEGEYITLFLLVDSGAVISALPKSDAEVFGIQAEKGAPFPVAGIDGQMVPGWRHEIPVHFGGAKYDLPIVFLDSPEVPRVLGREGVFNQFTVVFEEQKRRSALLDTKAKEARAISKMIDVIDRQEK